MTAEHKAALAELAAIACEFAAVRAEISEAESKVQALRASLDSVRARLNVARAAADSLLPPVVLLRCRQYRRDDPVPGVILKRTDKTITAKVVGNDDDLAMQFRQSKYNTSKWIEYPAKKCWSNGWMELLLPDASPAAAE